MAAKKAKANVTTPEGRLDYNHLVTPDTKFGPPTYQTSFSVDAATGRQMIADWEKLNPFFVGRITHRELDDGSIQFKVKQKRYIQWYDNEGKQQQKEQVPVLLNRDNSPYTGAEPWGGTTGVLAITLEETKSPQGPMVALRLKGVRFHDVVLGSAGSDDPLFGSAPTGVANEEQEGEFDDDIPFEN